LCEYSTNTLKNIKQKTEKNIVQHKLGKKRTSKDEVGRK